MGIGWYIMLNIGSFVYGWAVKRRKLKLLLDNIFVI